MVPLSFLKWFLLPESHSEPSGKLVLKEEEKQRQKTKGEVKVNLKKSARQ